MIAREKCPTCGGPVAVVKGTNHYVVANQREHTEALMEVEQQREALRAIRDLALHEGRPETDDLAHLILERANAGLRCDGRSA